MFVLDHLDAMLAEINLGDFVPLVEGKTHCPVYREDNEPSCNNKQKLSIRNALEKVLVQRPSLECLD